MPAFKDRHRRYRDRLRSEGATEVLLQLPLATLEAIDQVRAIQGCARRGDAVALLVQKALEAGNELKTI